MKVGIYEEIISKSVRNRILQIDNKCFYAFENSIDKAEAAQLLTQYITKILYHILKGITGEKSLEQQLTFCNDLILYIDHKLSEIDLTNNILEVEGKILNAILDKVGKTNHQLQNEYIKMLPETGLSTSALFTGSNSDLSIDTELEKEILSSDRIYWIVSFIRWSGLRIFAETLKKFTSEPGKELKIITTSYMGATEPKAIEFLNALPNTEIRISYNTKHERLHAKSYIFERNSGFDTAYIGSSNLSYSALTKGLEWNLKTTSRENKHIIDKAKGTFNSYWLNSDFEDYKIGGCKKLREALHYAKVKSTDWNVIPNFRIKPYPYQQEILEKLEAERQIHQSFKNLIVAATGIGKTVIAAFDYLNFTKQNPTNNHLLFIAHREEILKQSLATFRGILKDSEFGALWVGKYKSTSNSHLFVSVQTYNANRDFFESAFTPSYYQYIIVDEVHHIAADSYRPILDFFKPTLLLGLTATPERMNGVSILTDFNNRIAAETRLPDALRLGLLAPFQYFCVTDDTVNLRGISWVHGKYDTSQLEKLYTADDTRLHLILESIEKYLTDIDSTKALCFCVNRNHAKYMSDKFNAFKLRAMYVVSGAENDIEKNRKLVRQKLVSGEINFVFVVDMFNEGIDIPEINTTLFLRPTESLTVFLQQLGRGLRLSEGKECLTVLDFVSQAHEKYNFEDKFRSLVGKTHHRIDKEIRQGFPHLPFGCSIKMEQQAQNYILNNITSAVFNLNRLRKEIKMFNTNTQQELTLHNFLLYYNLNIQIIYRNNNCWTKLKNEALLQEYSQTSYSKHITKGLRRLILINSLKYLNFIEDLIANNFEIEKQPSPEYFQMLMMFYYDMWQKPLASINLTSIEHAMQEVANCKWIVTEMSEIISIIKNTLNFVPLHSSLPYPCVLEVHSRYSRDQLLALFELSTLHKAYNSQEGIIRIPNKRTELLLVTLNKSDKDFSPSTMYEDYALNEVLFHWQSQNSAHENSPIGESYIKHQEIGKTILLFIREQKKDEFGFTMPYIYLGPVDYQKHYGASPMSITWMLKEPMPAYLWKESAKMSIG